MMTLFKESADPTVTRFDPSLEILMRVRRGLKRRLLKYSGDEIASRPAGLGFFSDDRSQHGSDLLLSLPPTDILNLHWIASFFSYKKFFRTLPSGLPIVWTLHDMNPLTGGCHHAAGCNGFHARCGTCPQLGSAVENDLSRQIWKRKREAYDSISKERITFVTPSRWLAGKVKESSLAEGVRVDVIPNGLNTEIFRPIDKKVAREALGLAPDATYILFASYFSGDSYKGFPTLLEALRKVRDTPNLAGLTVGLGEPSAFDGSPIFIRSLGFIKAEEQMAFVYCAADLFVLPSLEDNFPNTALEALACGIPTLAFRVGGIPEIVRDGHTGRTVAPGDSDELARGIDELLADSARRNAMSKESRRIALAEYSLKLQAERYEALYQKLLEVAPPSKR